MELSNVIEANQSNGNAGGPTRFPLVNPSCLSVRAADITTRVSCIGLGIITSAVPEVSKPRRSTVTKTGHRSGSCSQRTDRSVRRTTRLLCHLYKKVL